jgi:hypothetical protein
LIDAALPEPDAAQGTAYSLTASALSANAGSSVTITA